MKRAPFMRSREPMAAGRQALRLTLAACTLAVALALPARADVAPSAQPSAEQFLTAAADSRELMAMVTHLSDGIGPRLTGTPPLSAAAAWACQRLRAWGIPAELEQVATPVRAWEVEIVEQRQLSPWPQPLQLAAVAWSGSTPGRVTGTPLPVDFTNLEDLAAAQRYRGRLRGRILLLSPERTPALQFTPTAVRWRPDELAAAAASTEATPRPGFYFRPRESFVSEVRRRADRARKRRAVEAFLGTEGVAAILVPSGFDHGLLKVEQSPNWTPGEPEPPAQLVISSEDASRLRRQLGRGLQPLLSIDVRARFGRTPGANVNVVGEIRGSGAPEDYVLIGAHLDSFHISPGAIDNAAGVAVAMEAMRLIRLSGARPSRSIRVGLWSGEEQGKIGSQDYARRHIARPTAQRVPIRIAAYLNHDFGSGQIRGIFLQGNAKWMPLMREALHPFRLLNADTVTLESTSASDHMVFDSLDVPSFQFIQDLLNVDSATGHSQIDTVDYVSERDLKVNAAILAHVALTIANMPVLPPRRGAVPDYDAP